MSMTERVARLRQQSLDAKPTISAERAELMTEFYQQNLGFVSEPVRRALSFKYLMERKTVYIGPGELVVGEKGPAPKATPTYPELCCHSLQDLDILNTREKTWYAVGSKAMMNELDTSPAGMCASSLKSVGLSAAGLATLTVAVGL